MRNYKISLIAAATAALTFMTSCGNKAVVDGVLSDTSGAEVVVRLLDVNKYQTLDTVKTDSQGRFTYKFKVAKNQPEFIYLFYKDKRIASLLLQAGDRVKVVADTLGTYTVSGSEECDKLVTVEKDQNDFINRFTALQARYYDLNPSSAEAAAVRSDLARQFVSYYRTRVRYVMENAGSLTTVPVLYETLPDGTPIFSQSTDAIHFRNACDTLAKIYPDSRYVKALEKEAERRFKVLAFDTQIKNAGETSFIDITLPDVKGEKVSLSDVKGKVVMVYFWAAGLAEQKMFNLDVIKPVYSDFHDKGFDIYAVSLDNDKALWASVVKNQALPWVNVCDGLGTASQVVNTYNVRSIPSLFFLVNGELVSGTGVKDEASLRAFLKKNL